VHALNAGSGLLYVLGPFPPAGSQSTYFRRGPKRLPQQSIGVQLQQPLAFLHVALPPGQILGVSRIHQPYLETGLLQYVVHRYPVHPGRLHHHRLDPALVQEFGQPLQVRRKTPEHLHRLAIPIRSHRHIMLPAPDIDARGVSMHHIQTGLIAPDLPPQLFSLLACEPFALFPFRRLIQHCAVLNQDLFSAVRPGRDFFYHSLQRGRAADLPAAATNFMIARTGAMLMDGQVRASVMSAIACRTSLLSFSLSFWLL
jgi:hypothetical protein